jgi:hypothetical protein
MDSATAVRDLQLMNSRYVIQGNTITNCHCHALLLQAPYGLVTRNTMAGTAYNAVRLLTSVGPFKMGAGAFDVIVRQNDISGTGGDNSMKMPWAAISAYGVTRGNTVALSPVNSDLQILDNRISNVEQGCITVMSSRRVTVSGNSCDANASVAGDGDSPAITVRNASAVAVRENRLSGRFAGKVDVDAATTHDVRYTPQ